MPWVHLAGVPETGAEVSCLGPITSITHAPQRGRASAFPQNHVVGHLSPRVISACRFLSGWPLELHLCLP